MNNPTSRRRAIRSPAPFRTSQVLPRQSQQLKEAPPDWPGSLPEFLVDEELRRLGLRSGFDYTYQSSAFGGRQELGGAVLDFEFNNPPGLAISVLGVYYHFIFEGGSQVDENLRREQLAGLNITLIFIEDGHILDDVQYYVGEALQYRDHSRLGRGG